MKESEQVGAGAKVRGQVLGALGRVTGFLAEVRTELQKSTWPERGELMESTAVVIISVALLSLFVGISDTVLVNLVRLMVR